MVVRQDVALLVDDDADFCDMMRVLLERQGFEAVPYGRAREALADFRELPGTWDALVTDQNMPDMTGLELLQALRAEGFETPFGFVTSEGSAEMREMAEAAGALFLIAKPFTPESFRDTIEPCLA